MKSGTLWEIALAVRILRRCMARQAAVTARPHALAEAIEALSAQVSESGRPVALAERGAAE